MEEITAKRRGYKKPELINIEEIRSGKINESEIEKMWCSFCGALGHIYHYTKDGTIFFRCTKHHDGCESQSEDEKENDRLIVKKKKIYTNTTLNNDLILFGKDRAPIIKIKNEPKDDDGDGEKEGDGDNNIPPEINPGKEPDDTTNNPTPTPEDEPGEILSTPDEEERKEEAFYYEFGEKNISCTSLLFKEIQAVGYSFNMGDGRTAGDLLLDDIALHKIRREGFRGLKIALLTRPSKEDVEFLKKNKLYYTEGNLEHLFLKDAFATNPEDTIFFDIKCQNKEQDRFFKTLVMGSKYNTDVQKDRRKYIVVYSMFERIPNEFVSIYRAEITFRQYAFTNNITIGKD